MVAALAEGPLSSSPQTADKGPQVHLEFSAKVIQRSDGRLREAQLFVKGDRYRLEHRGGVRTDLGYAGVSIVRLDKQEVWFLLSQRRQFLVVPIRPDHRLPLASHLEGETSRLLIGEASSGGRPARLYELTIAGAGGAERYYQWVDAEQDLPLKLISLDRDWSVEYQHVVFSKQADYFFEVPLGYRRWEQPPVPQEKG
ncbi:MAG: hypothetical protein E6K63_10845 [Nitrospirae bacterium]|nr:MAG: hypothetical protein E6K63_10845 [Nitrospirota bacterium]